MSSVACSMVENINFKLCNEKVLPVTKPKVVSSSPAKSTGCGLSTKQFFILKEINLNKTKIGI